MSPWHRITDFTILGYLALPIWWLFMMLLFKNQSITPVAANTLYPFVTMLGFAPVILFGKAIRRNKSHRNYAGLVISIVPAAVAIIMFLVGLVFLVPGG